MGYNWARLVTIDHTQCGSTDSTNFPFLFSTSDTPFKLLVNGGQVTNANGYDIIFALDSAGTMPLPFELEFYDPVAGTVIAWVQLPTLTHSSNTLLYIIYGNSAITTFQGNVNGTWDSTFALVTHYGNGSTLSLTDSTANGRNGTNSTIPIVAVAGQIAGAGTPHYAGLGHQAYVTYVDTGLPSGASSRTISMWINFQSAGAQGYSWQLGQFLTANAGFSLAPDRNPLVFYDGGAASTFAFNPSTGVWYNLVVTFASSGTLLTVYVNGASIGTATLASLNTVLSGLLYTFETDPTVFNANVDAYMDEFRVATVARSVDWIVSEYNNQNAPTSFYSLGSPTPPPSSGGLPSFLPAPPEMFEASSVVGY